MLLVGDSEEKDSEGSLERRGEGWGVAIPRAHQQAAGPHTMILCRSGGLPHNMDSMSATCTSSGTPDSGGSSSTLYQNGCRMCGRFLQHKAQIERRGTAQEDGRGELQTDERGDAQADVYGVWRSSLWGQAGPR